MSENKVKILFVCLGNICRSPMAEMIMKKMVKDAGREEEFEISSAATSDEVIGYYCCPLKVSEQRDIHPQCCCNGIADDFSEGKPLS